MMNLPAAVLLLMTCLAAVGQKLPTVAVLRNKWFHRGSTWKQVTGKAREKWGKLTDNDWSIVAGKKDQLVGKIQERYGIRRDEAEKQADEWARELKEEQIHS